MLQLKKEAVSLSLDMNPPIIKGDKSYTVFDVEGNPETFTPSFHVSCQIFQQNILDEHLYLVQCIS